MAQVNQTVKHGTETYEPDIDYKLDPELHDYFAANGWLVGSERPEAPVISDNSDSLDIEPENAGVFDTVLEVDNSVIDTTSDEVNNG